MTIAITRDRLLVRLTLADLWRLLWGRELRAEVNGSEVKVVGRGR